MQADRAWSLEEQGIGEWLMPSMIIEASLCIEEGVAESADVIEFTLVLGGGFQGHVGERYRS